MAFTGNLKNFSTTPQETEVTKESLDFLSPKKDFIKDSMNDPYKAQMTQKNAYQYTMKTLNALKIVSPVISALMQTPGLNSSNTDLSNNFKLLISEISTISERVCEKLNIDPQKEQNFWIRNVLERSFSEIVQYQWIHHGQINIAVLEPLVDEVMKYQDNTAEKLVYDDISEESMVKLATIKAALPILNQAQENSLYRNLEEDIEHIMTKLFEASKKAVEKIANDYADEKDRAKLFYLIMQEAGSLYSISWKVEADRVNKIIDKYPPEKLKSVLDKYKESGGLPLTKIESDFDKYFDKVLVITERLISSSKGPIKKRLNN